MTDISRRRLRVLWYSDAPWSTSGYGVQSAITVPHLGKYCDVAYGCTYGLQGGVIDWKGIPVYPGGADAFANDVIKQWAQAFKADIVITLKDLPAFRPEALQGLRWVPLIPVDHEPITPMVSMLARHSWAPVAYAPNGVRELSRIGLMPYYAPHVFDKNEMFRVDRVEAREKLGLPQDAFVVATVAVNRGDRPSRKAWPELIEGYKAFAANHPNSIWMAHTYLGDDGFEGSIPLRLTMGEMLYNGRIRVPEMEQYKRGFPTEYLRTLYSAADVLLAPSLGEGFGVPVLEAQACGTPVIVGDWAATADLCFAGIKIGKDYARPYWSSQNSYQYIPMPSAIAETLAVMARLSEDDKATMTANAIAATRAFEVEAVVENHWKPILEHISHRINQERFGRGVLKIVTKGQVL